MQPVRRPVCRAQHHRGRVTEGGPLVPPQQPGIGATEGLDRRVGVTDQDDLHSGMGDGPQQPGRRPGELLGVIDDDLAHVVAQPGQRLRVVVEQVGCRREDPRRVICARLRERGHLVVFIQDGRRRDPLGSVMEVAELGEPGRLNPVLDGPHEQVAQLGPEPPGAQRGQHPIGPLRPDARCRVPG